LAQGEEEMKKNKKVTICIGYLCCLIFSTNVDAQDQNGNTDFVSVSNSLVVYLPFERNANDMSDYGNDGIVYGARLTTDQVGEKYSAYAFDSVNDQIVIPNSRSTSTLNFSKGYTIAAWINPSDVSAGYHVIASKGKNAFSLRLNGDKLEACHHRSDGATSCQTARGCTVKTGQWSHVAVAWNGGLRGDNWQMYLDGEACSYTGTVTGLVASSEGDIAIGSDDWYKRWYFGGIIDSVHIYNRGLVADEIYTLAFEMDDSLVAWYPFWGNTDDMSGYGNDGTIEGIPVLLSDRFGNPAGSYYFGISNDRVGAADSPSTNVANFQNGYTAAAWIYPTSVSPGYHVIASKGRNVFSIRLNGDKLEACHHMANGMTGCQTAANCDVSAYAWNHVAVTWNGYASANNWQMYLNGTPCSYTGSADGLISSGTGKLSIGADDWYERWYFKGVIDTVRVFNRALSAFEISALTTFPD
jgi:hypothetical protein